MVLPNRNYVLRYITVGLSRFCLLRLEKDMEKFDVEIYWYLEMMFHYRVLIYYNDDECIGKWTSVYYLFASLNDGYFTNRFIFQILIIICIALFFYIFRIKSLEELHCVFSQSHPHIVVVYCNIKRKRLIQHTTKYGINISSVKTFKKPEVMQRKEPLRIILRVKQLMWYVSFSI